jgi:2-deoxy-D-gluconate 3-dehydrogenase
VSMFSLNGRTAIVTGGNRGLGFGIAQGLTNAGAAVVIAARDTERNAAAVAAISATGGTVTAVKCDVRDDAEVAATIATAVDRFGGLDVVVANAGYGNQIEPMQESNEQWDQVLDINLSSVFRLCKAAHPHLSRSHGASVITVSSINTVLANPKLASYGASKGGLEALTKSLAGAWAADGIRVNALVPGFFWSDLTAALASDELAERREAIIAGVPLGRIADPSEMAGPAVFLASDASSFVTGASLIVDGGLTTTV